MSDAVEFTPPFLDTRFSHDSLPRPPSVPLCLSVGQNPESESHGMQKSPCSVEPFFIRRPGTVNHARRVRLPPSLLDVLWHKGHR